LPFKQKNKQTNKQIQQNKTKQIITSVLHDIHHVKVNIVLFFKVNVLLITTSRVEASPFLSSFLSFLSIISLDQLSKAKKLPPIINYFF